MSVETSLMARRKRDDTAVKIASAIYRKAKLIAAHRDIPIAEYVSGLLERPVERDYAKLISELGGGCADRGNGITS